MKQEVSGTIRYMWEFNWHFTKLSDLLPTADI